MSLNLLASVLAVGCVSGKVIMTRTQLQINEYYELSTPTNWADAKAACESRKDRLAIIQNDQQNTTAAQKCTSRRCWIGLTDAAKEGTFVWVDGTPLTYAKWDGGEPNNAGSGENCVELLVEKNGWNDHFCSTVKNGLCELRFELTLSITRDVLVLDPMRDDNLVVSWAWKDGKIPTANGPSLMLVTPAGVNSRSEQDNYKFMSYRGTLQKATGTAYLSCNGQPGYKDVKVFGSESGMQVGNSIRFLCATNGIAQPWPSVGINGPSSGGPGVLAAEAKGETSSTSVRPDVPAYALVGGIATCLVGIACCVVARTKLRRGYDMIE